MEIHENMRGFQGSWISMEFDIFRYVSIFLTYFGHNLGTKGRECQVIDRPYLR